MPPPSYSREQCKVIFTPRQRNVPSPLKNMHTTTTYPTKQPQTHHSKATPNTREMETDDQPLTPENLPTSPIGIAHLIDALTTDDHHIKALIQALPNDCSDYNAKSTMVTKRQLLQCA